MTEKENEKLAAELRSCGEELIGIAGQLAAGAEAPDGTSEKTAGAAEKTKDAEMAEEVQEKAVTKEDVRAVLAVKLKEGYKEEIRELFEKYGGSRLKEIDPSHYSELMKDAEGLGHA